MKRLSLVQRFLRPVRPILAGAVGWMLGQLFLCISALPVHASVSAVIGPGQEDLLATMLGSGEVLPGDCRFDSGVANPQGVEARYLCAGRVLVLELLHRGGAGAGTPHSRHFALRTKEGVAPPLLIDALLQRIGEREDEFSWLWLGRRSSLETLLEALAAVVPSVTLAWALAWALWRARASDRNRTLIRWGVAALIRAAGLLLVALAVACGEHTGSFAPWWIRVGMFLLVSFLWLVASGFFAAATPRRDIWPGLGIFLLALLLREGLARHSVEGVEIGFVTDVVGRHSVIYPLWQAFFAPWVSDPHAFTMHLNGFLGAAACWYAYRFVAHRSGSSPWAMACVLALALHPVVARFAPTDGPYSFLFATWFAGLALLATPTPTARACFGGIVLLGLAASCRIEGSFYLAASSFLLPWQSVRAAWRQDRSIVILACLVVASLLVLQMSALFLGYASGRLGTEEPLAVFLPRAHLLLRDAVWPMAYADPWLTVFLWLGVLAGVLGKQRLGVRLYLAMCVVLFPVVGSGQSAHALHRMLPVYALHALGAGTGMAWAGRWLALRTRRSWSALVPASLLCAAVLLRQQASLSTPYVFTEEYDLVRRHLATPRGSDGDCSLAAFNLHPAGDIDLHDFAQVVPRLPIVDCRQHDCVAAAAAQPCLFYVRSAACYFHNEGIPPACSAQAQGADCLSSECGSFEKAVRLVEIETRVIDILGTFPDRGRQYPESAEVGLFRVTGLALDPSPPPGE